MKFFEHQKKARAATIKLLLLFVFAVISVSGFMSAALIFVFSKPIRAWAIRRNDFIGDAINLFEVYFSPFIWLALFFVVFVLMLSAMRLAELRSGGGDFVAESLEGKLLQSHETELSKKQLVNIVEEMGIASGLPVPRVYLIEEQGINAFAAGWTISDAVIGVTSGCVNALTREEMQDVIAHEFSHILNGDMRLNMRLMAAVYGIAFFADWGNTMKLAALASYRKPADKALMLFLGLLIWMIGSVGLFFAKIIQAAVSRQREFLADASAVQFTRNPDGIVGALQKIERSSAGSSVSHRYAFEASHLFFGEIGSKSEALLATHPTITERIGRIKGVRFISKERSKNQLV
ncbi:MAG: M48 family metallopeptidase [Neisseriaceae bacterium]|nr:M48 family metallopeptidase [Neisseriaceae bacterium]